MNLKALLDKIPKSDLINYLNQKPKEFSSLDPEEAKVISKEIVEEIRIHINKRKTGKIIELVLLGVHIRGKSFLTHATREGFLRHSTYLDQPNPLPTISKSILLHPGIFPLSDNEKVHMMSLSNMILLYEELKLLNKQLHLELLRLYRTETKLKNFGVKLGTIRTLLNYNERNFLLDYDSEDKVHDLNDLNHYTKEEISESISMIVSKWEEKFGLNREDIGFADYQLFNSGRLSELILKGCQIKYFKELEILVEKFDYSCVTESKKIVFKCENISFEKAYELSLIVTAKQEAADNYKLFEKYKEAMSFAQVSEKIHEHSKEIAFLSEKPTKRYSFRIPVPVFEMICHKDRTFFKEEIFLAESIEKQLLIPFEEVSQFKIGEKITLSQFINLHKYFLLLNEIIGKKILSIIEVEPEIAFNSLCAVFTEDGVYDMLKPIESEDIITEYLDIMTWEAGVDKFLDLQYRPLIFTDGFYCITPCVISNSRMFRNIFPSEAKKNNMLMTRKNKSYDKLVDVTENVLKEAGFQVKKGLPIKYKTTEQNQSDIDVFAVKGNIALVIECKDTIWPVGIHELRTSYEQVLKASDQLSYIMKALSDNAFKTKFLTDHKFDPEEIHTVHPIIILPNKLFWGYNISGIPIRNIHDFNNFLGTGEWDLQVPDYEKGTFSLWATDQISNDDIKNYLDAEKNPYSCLYDSFVPFQHNYKDKILVNKLALEAFGMFKNAKDRLRVLKIEELSREDEDE